MFLRLRSGSVSATAKQGRKLGLRPKFLVVSNGSTKSIYYYDQEVKRDLMTEGFTYKMKNDKVRKIVSECRRHGLCSKIEIWPNPKITINK